MNRTHDMLLWLVAAMCGLAVAAIAALLASLIAALLHAGPVVIFTIGGSTFGAALTLEIGLGGLYAALRRHS